MESLPSDYLAHDGLSECLCLENSVVKEVAVTRSLTAFSSHQWPSQAFNIFQQFSAAFSSHQKI
jgi:hypothetical protein